MLNKFGRVVARGVSKRVKGWRNFANGALSLRKYPPFFFSIEALFANRHAVKNNVLKLQ